MLICFKITFHVSVVIVPRCSNKVFEILQGIVMLNTLNALLNFANRSATSFSSSRSATSSSSSLPSSRLVILWFYNIRSFYLCNIYHRFNAHDVSNFLHQEDGSDDDLWNDY